MLSDFFPFDRAEKRDLEKIFGKYGPLKEIWLANASPCFAFVVYKYAEDANRALDEDGVEVWITKNTWKTIE